MEEKKRTNNRRESMKRDRKVYNNIKEKQQYKHSILDLSPSHTLTEQICPFPYKFSILTRILTSLG